MARDLISDEEWAFFERFILSARAPNGRKPANHRLVLDGIFWIARTGAPWRDLPEEFGKWSSVYRQFRRWTLVGLWAEIIEALNESGGRARRLANDRQHRDPGPSSGSGCERGAPRQGFGRSRASDGKTVHWTVFWTIYHFTIKIHLRVNAHGLPMRTEITPGQTSDYLGFDLVMAKNLLSPSVLLADRGYDGDRIRAKLIARNVLPVIPMRKSRKKRIGVDRSLYRLRNLVERCFNKLKNVNRHAKLPPVTG